MVYFHKIDKENLNSEKDVEFLKKMKKYSTEDAADDDCCVYLFGLKLDYETLYSLLENGNLIQSIISCNRCLFCLKQ